MCPLTMSSSAFVISRKERTPRDTVSGAPTNEYTSEWFNPASSTGAAHELMSSMGGASFPGVPRRSFTNDCCSEVNRWRAWASVSAAMMLAATIA